MGANAGKFLLTRKSALLADIVTDRQTDGRFACEDDGRRTTLERTRRRVVDVRSGVMVYPKTVFLVCFIRDRVTIKNKVVRTCGMTSHE